MPSKVIIGVVIDPRDRNARRQCWEENLRNAKNHSILEFKQHIYCFFFKKHEMSRRNTNKFLVGSVPLLNRLTINQSNVTIGHAVHVPNALSKIFSGDMMTKQ